MNNKKIKIFLTITFNIKTSLQVFLIMLLLFSCRTLPKFKSWNSFAVERNGIMDTLTVNVTGKTIDLYDKFGLKGAKIELTNNENSYSKTCKENGEFKFEHISSGKYKIISSFLGYSQLRDSIELRPGEIIELEIRLGYEE